MRLTALACAVAILHAASAVCAEPSAEERIRALERALEQQREEIRELRRLLNEQKTSATLTRQQAQQAEAKATAVETAQKRLPRWLERLSLFGDLRVRYEGFYHRPEEAGEPVTIGGQARLRARLGATYRFGDELAATIMLASGNPNNPISNNQTFTDDFTPKAINLNWAYLTFTPGKTFGVRPGLVALTAGKFELPFFRVGELVYDNDLAVEGFSEVVQLLAEPIGPLQQVRLFAQQWAFNEALGEPDGWVFGGQVNPMLQLGPAQLELGIAQWWYLNPDQIAVGLNSNSSLVNTNLVVTGMVDGEQEIVAYRSGFNLTNLTIAATVPNVLRQMPVKLFLEYVHNWQAATSRSNGIQVGAKLGQVQVRGDWAVSALYEFLAQEAALSAFTWSDFGTSGTNLQGPVFAIDYQLLDPLTLTARTFITNYIQAPPLTTNPTLFRLQLDALVRF